MTTNGSSQTAAFIGVDVGGTHTDVSVFLGDRVERGKALTTYDDFSRGVLEAVTVAAREFDMDLGELLGRTQLFINGTTVVTNTITTMRGSKVGVLATHGFKDFLRLAGGARTTEIDDHLQVSVPDIIDRRGIREIDERVDWSGTVLVPVDLDQVRTETRWLVEELDIDALAICFLWSHANGEHELAAEAAVKELYPDMFITPSHRVFPVEGETRRFTTAVLNSYVQDKADIFLTSLNEKLREAGLKGGPRVLPGPRRRHQPREGPPVPARPSRIRPGRRRHRVQRAGQADGAQGRAARRHGRHELRHRDHRRQRDPHRQEPPARPVPDRGQPGRRRLGRRRRRLDRLDQRARRPAGRAPERRLDAGPRVAGPRRGGADGDRRDGHDGLHRPRGVSRRAGQAQSRAGQEGPRQPVRRALRVVDGGGGGSGARPRRRQHGQRRPRGERRQGPRPARVPVPGLRGHAAAVRLPDRRAAGDPQDRDPEEQLRLLRARPAHRGLRDAQRPGRRLGPQQAGGAGAGQRDRRRDGRERARGDARRGLQRGPDRDPAQRATSATTARSTSSRCHCRRGRSPARTRSRWEPSSRGSTSARTARAPRGRACRSS